jgi:predicted dehydrogenase
MNVLLLGMGYWGQILYKNIVELYPNADLQTWDPRWDDPLDRAEKLSRSSHVIVATPAMTHYEIVKECLKKGKHVFCEKPLVLRSAQAEELYALAESEYLKLHVDWVFCFNPVIQKLKKKIQMGELAPLRSVFMNRLNLGPVRYDVNARWDLLSHDISILFYLLNDSCKLRGEFFDLKLNNSDIETPSDTSIGVVGIVDKKQQCVGYGSINTSWGFGEKVRDCWFQFGDEIVYWNDAKGVIRHKGEEEVYGGSPLHASIRYFFENSVHTVNTQKDLTLKITKFVENDSRVEELV